VKILPFTIALIAIAFLSGSAIGPVGGLIDIVRLLLEQGASAWPICGPATRAQALVRLIAELSADVF
jgi:hypothetical protein